MSHVKANQVVRGNFIILPSNQEPKCEVHKREENVQVLVCKGYATNTKPCSQAFPFWTPTTASNLKAVHNEGTTITVIHELGQTRPKERHRYQGSRQTAFLACTESRTWWAFHHSRHSDRKGSSRPGWRRTLPPCIQTRPLLAPLLPAQSPPAPDPASVAGACSPTSPWHHSLLAARSLPTITAS